MADVKISLASARVNAGLTQEQAAKEVGVSKSTIISWEKGRTDIPFRSLAKLCDVYGFPVDNIFVPYDLT